MKWLAAFLALVIIDFIWARYVKAIAEDRAVEASLLSSTIIALGGFSTWIFIHDPWLIIPEALGAFCGTWISITWEKRRGAPHAHA